MRHLTCSASPSSFVPFSWESVFGELSCTGYKQIHMALVGQSRKQYKDLNMARDREGGTYPKPGIMWGGGFLVYLHFNCISTLLRILCSHRAIADDTINRQRFPSHYITAVRGNRDKASMLCCFCGWLTIQKETTGMQVLHKRGWIPGIVSFWGNVPWTLGDSFADLGWSCQLERSLSNYGLGWAEGGGRNTDLT